MSDGNDAIMSTSEVLGVNGDRLRPSWSFFLLLAVLVACVPALALYFQLLWSRDHYQFFPFVLVFVGWMIYQRHQEFGPVRLVRSSWLGDLCLLLAIPFFLFHFAVFEIDFAAIGCFFVAASLLVRLRDRDGIAFARTLVLPLAIIVRPPFNLDTQLIAQLQRTTSVLTGTLLDAIGVLHIRSGNVITLPTRIEPLMVEEACSGVQSLFTLIFVAAAWSVWSERNLVHSMLLLVAAVFWACFGNLLRVTSICLADYWFGVDLVAEPQHAILGYVCLAVGIGLVVSTDLWLESVRAFCFGKSAGMAGTNGSSRGAKESAGARGERVGVLRPASGFKTGSAWRNAMTLGVCGLLCFLALGPTVLAGPGRLAKYMFAASSVAELERAAFPEFVQVPGSAFAQWSVQDFNIEERDRSSVWGSRSASWQIECATGPRPIDCHFSCDYPFSDWHELSVCYRGNGWKIVGGGRVVHRLEGQEDWPVVSVEFANESGGHALLLFSLFDEGGRPVLPPEDDVLNMNYVTRFRSMVQRRFGKSYGPKPSTFQVQAFIPLKEAITGQEKAELVSAYSRLRNEVVAEAVEMDLG